MCSDENMSLIIVSSSRGVSNVVEIAMLYNPEYRRSVILIRVSDGKSLFFLRVFLRSGHPYGSMVWGGG